MKKPAKIDLYKIHKADYAAKQAPALVRIASAKYLAVSGQGEPGGQEFKDRIGALYGAAYTIKMTRKFAGKQDYAVCKLEAQWWTKSGAANFASAPKSDWCWKLLIRTPGFITSAHLKSAQQVLLQRGKSASVRQVKLESMKEGLCVQMLHIGPYDQEPQSIARMQAHAEQNNLRFHGLHHEIYLSDPRRVQAERLKTILRIPATKQRNPA